MILLLSTHTSQSSWAVVNGSYSMEDWERVARNMATKPVLGYALGGGLDEPEEEHTEHLRSAIVRMP